MTDRQPQPSPAKAPIRRRVRLAEGLKNPIEFFWRDTHAGIFHAKMYHVVHFGRRIYLQKDFAGGRELDRVVQNIEEDLPYPGDVADYRRRCSRVDPGVDFKPLAKRHRSQEIHCLIDYVP